jgi:peptidoglycan/LPS O-acetylase OafA/YrhL
VTSPVPSGATPKLDALTGIRILAAMWVVVFHFRGNLATEFSSYRFVAPVVDYGELGVELFFTLSGFVIGLVYARKLGARWSWPASLKFWWARFVRLWPAYMFVLLLVTAWHLFFVVSNEPDPVAPRDFTPLSFVRQVLMVVQWTEADSDRLTWNGPAWTVSAEVLAYLLFPILAVLTLRSIDRIATVVLPFLAVACTAPLIMSAVVRGSLYEPWSWLLRIGCCFLAGYITFFFYERVKDDTRGHRWGGLIFVAAGAVFLAILAGAYLSGHEEWGFLGIALMPIMIGALAVDRSVVARVLSTRPFVLGGMISYSVYLVHMPVIEPLWYLQGIVPWLAPGTPASGIAFLLIPVAVLLAGYALWRWVEEPCRRALKNVWDQSTPAQVEAVDARRTTSRD